MSKTKEEIKAGDKVMCLVGYYKSYGYGSIATVERLDISGAGNPVLILKNPLSDCGTSMYSMENWKFHSRPKEIKHMGYARTLYFAGKLANFVEEQGQIPRISDRTIGRHTKSEVIKDVRGIIQDGEQWVVLQTVGFIKTKEPVPELAQVEFTECR